MSFKFATAFCGAAIGVVVVLGADWLQIGHRFLGSDAGPGGHAGSNGSPGPQGCRSGD